jgi:hypothetical protein
MKKPTVERLFSCRCGLLRCDAVGFLLFVSASPGRNCGAGLSLIEVSDATWAAGYFFLFFFFGFFWVWGFLFLGGGFLLGCFGCGLFFWFFFGGPGLAGSQPR